jgi:hypothetical protein
MAHPETDRAISTSPRPTGGLTNRGQGLLTSRTGRSGGSCDTSDTATRETGDVLVALPPDTLAVHPRDRAYAAPCSVPSDFLDLPCSRNIPLWRYS